MLDGDFPQATLVTGEIQEIRWCNNNTMGTAGFLQPITE